jgi:hypothetical protein
MKWAVASFDLTGAESQDCEMAHTILTNLGFITFTRSPKVELPATVVMRQVGDGVSAEEIRDVIKEAFQRVGLTPKRVFGGLGCSRDEASVT